MKRLTALLLSIGLCSVASADVIRVAESDFNAGAGLITFSEYSLGTVNPFYTPIDYGGAAGDPDVSFDGWFTGQSLSTVPGTDCPGSAPTACVVGTPTGPLSLDGSSPDTFITTDGSNPTSPVLSGTPRFSGPIAILFSTDQFGVGFDGGFFDLAGSTAITAFDRAGGLLGSVSNTGTGIEFLGLVTDDDTASIAGVFLDLIGSEPFGFAIDNIRFGGVGDIDIDDGDNGDSDVPEPETLMLMLISLLAVRAVRRR
ncbi:PEP-CTERM sorting domain-containing protein [Alteromonas sp. ASW11-130]|uniref:PEP-CTERM sorting domain-containing protein n=1 Tax=Alteromonas sp. ASW11-130 TaxID=3015775 RepID=UPI0022428949|nr:PEP-CTERM sorting domain-containing protein [Alteromonas sp. ASW11-130]MCW8092564.1 PEP-CTERM sorting domain-containing protein [Alteromonas sp. ASW11-130]